MEKSADFWGKYRVQAVSWVLCLGISGCTSLAFAARFLAFWTMPGSLRLLVVVTGMMILALPVYLLMQPLRHKWVIQRNFKGKIWLAVAFSAGITFWLATVHPVAQIPTMHHVEIETFPSDAVANPNVVNILEFRGYDGEIVKPEIFGISGEWQVRNNGFFASRQRSAKLTHSFYAWDEKKFKILIERNPDGGRAIFKVDDTIQNVDLNSLIIDQQILVFPLNGKNRWVGFVRAADFAAAIGIFAALYFVTAFYLNRWFAEIRLRIRLNPVHYDIFFIVIFLILLVLPLYNITASISNFDNRFYFRTQILRGWSNFRFQFLGDRIFNNSVLVGKGNWLIYIGESSLDDYQNTLKFTEADLVDYQSKLDSFYDRMKAKGITFLVVVVPNKNTIYPEYFPPQIPVIGKQSFLDKFLEYQKSSGKVQLLDLRPALLKARKERQVYYSNDTHWNPYGALVGYQEILSSLKNDFPILQPHSLDNYEYINDGMKYGDLADPLGHIEVKENNFLLDPKHKLPVSSWDARGLNGTTVITTTAMPDHALPKLVMYHDSFTVSLVPLFSTHFSHAVYLWTFDIDEAFIDAEKPDIVMIEVTERYLPKMLNSLESSDGGGLSLNE